MYRQRAKQPPKTEQIKTNKMKNTKHTHTEKQQERIMFLTNLQELNNSLIDWVNEGTGLTLEHRKDLLEQIGKNQKILNKKL